jgi:hypothetical protein
MDISRHLSSILYLPSSGETWRLLGNAMLSLVFLPVLLQPRKILEVRALQERIVGPFVADG